VSRTPPAAARKIPDRLPSMPKPIPVAVYRMRFVSPPGVTLTSAGDEPNLMPVLVCGSCLTPTQHIRAFVGQLCRCRTCGTERKW